MLIYPEQLFPAWTPRCVLLVKWEVKHFNYFHVQRLLLTARFNERKYRIIQPTSLPQSWCSLNPTLETQNTVKVELFTVFFQTTFGSYFDSYLRPFLNASTKLKLLSFGQSHIELTSTSCTLFSLSFLCFCVTDLMITFKSKSKKGSIQMVVHLMKKPTVKTEIDRFPSLIDPLKPMWTIPNSMSLVDDLKVSRRKPRKILYPYFPSNQWGTTSCLFQNFTTVYLHDSLDMETVVITDHPYLKTYLIIDPTGESPFKISDGKSLIRYPNSLMSKSRWRPVRVILQQLLTDDDTPSAPSHLLLNLRLRLSPSLRRNLETLDHLLLQWTLSLGMIKLNHLGHLYLMLIKTRVPLCLCSPTWRNNWSVFKISCISCWDPTSNTLWMLPVNPSSKITSVVTKWNENSETLHALTISNDIFGLRSNVLSLPSVALGPLRFFFLPTTLYVPLFVTREPL